MGLMISAFEALTLLPPKRESFRCFYHHGGAYVRVRQNLDTVSNLVGKHHTADLGYRKTAKSKQMGFMLGLYWFPVTKARVNKMLKKYGYEIAD